MSTEDPNKGTDAKGEGATSPPQDPPKAQKAEPGPVKVGERVDILMLVGGPEIKRFPATVKAILKSPPKGKPAGTYLQLTMRTPSGADTIVDAVCPEPAEGVHLNSGGSFFPCWARVAAPA